MKFVKAEVPEGMKEKFQALSKKKGETEAALIRKALNIYMKQEAFKGDKGPMMGMGY